VDLYPQVDRSRLFHYGGSQGGHIALLSAAYAPGTFAWVYAASPVTHLAPQMQEWAGRTFAPHELAARDVARLAPAIRCPVYLEHGTADPTVPCEEHTRSLFRHLQALGKTVQATFYEGGDHGLAPISSRYETFKATAPERLRTLRRAGEDDFAAGRTVRVDCGERHLVIDWSRPIHDAGVCRWEQAGEQEGRG
jgi:dipeptidyl aminopeptidase/acylaminoacyl peptidase